MNRPVMDSWSEFRRWVEVSAVLSPGRDAKKRASGQRHYVRPYWVAQRARSDQSCEDDRNARTNRCRVRRRHRPGTTGPDPLRESDGFDETYRPPRARQRLPCWLQARQ